MFKIEWHSLYTSVTNSVFLLAIIATPIDCAHIVAYACTFVLMRTTGLLRIGKGHQQYRHMGYMYVLLYHGCNIR